jgi:hypothetical protein
MPENKEKQVNPRIPSTKLTTASPFVLGCCGIGVGSVSLIFYGTNLEMEENGLQIDYNAL